MNGNTYSADVPDIIIWLTKPASKPHLKRILTALNDFYGDSIHRAYDVDYCADVDAFIEFLRWPCNRDIARLIAHLFDKRS